MGVYYWLANHTDKTYIDLNSAKISEMDNQFDRQLIYLFLRYYAVQNSVNIEFVADETGGWERITNQGYKDVTCDILVSWFEDSNIPTRWQVAYCYDKFKEATRLTEFAEWMRKWDNVKDR